MARDLPPRQPAPAPAHAPGRRQAQQPGQIQPGADDQAAADKAAQKPNAAAPYLAPVTGGGRVPDEIVAEVLDQLGEDLAEYPRTLAVLKWFRDLYNRAGETMPGEESETD